MIPINLFDSDHTLQSEAAPTKKTNKYDIPPAVSPDETLSTIEGTMLFGGKVFRDQTTIYYAGLVADGKTRNEAEAYYQKASHSKLLLPLTDTIDQDGLTVYCFAADPKEKSLAQLAAEGIPFKFQETLLRLLKFLKTVYRRNGSRPLACIRPETVFIDEEDGSIRALPIYVPANMCLDHGEAPTEQTDLADAALTADMVCSAGKGQASDLYMKLTNMIPANRGTLDAAINMLEQEQSQKPDRDPIGNKTGSKCPVNIEEPTENWLHAAPKATAPKAGRLQQWFKQLCQSMKRETENETRGTWHPEED